MKWRLGYRTIVNTSELPMELTLNFDRWEDRYRSAFQLMVAFAFWAPSTPTECRLMFRDPDASNRDGGLIEPTMVILDTLASGIGPLQSFYEDNLGQGFALPWRERTALPYQVLFSTPDGQGEGGCALQTMVWWEPKFPSVDVWEMLCKMPGLVAGIERSAADTMEVQTRAGDELFEAVQELARQGRLPKALRRFVGALDGADEG